MGFHKLQVLFVGVLGRVYRSLSFSRAPDCWKLLYVPQVRSVRPSGCSEAFDAEEKGWGHLTCEALQRFLGKAGIRRRRSPLGVAQIIS